MKKTSRIIASGFQVYCRYDEILAIGKLKPNPKNPNKHPARQVELLARIIREQGWRNPITVSRRSGLIVRGHGRFEAAKMLNATHVPVEYQNYKSKESENADMVADNKISELSNMDDMMLKTIIMDIKETSFDVSLTGLDSEELMDILEDDKEKEKAPASQSKYLKFIKVSIDEYRIENVKKEHLADIKPMQTGRFKHWHFCPRPETVYTNGCLAEIEGFIKKLFSSSPVHSSTRKGKASNAI